MGAPTPPCLSPPELSLTRGRPLPQRLDPIGSDVKRNKYYFLDDHRLWIHRAPPPARRAPTSKPASAKSEGKGKAKAKPATAPAANKNKKKRALSPELAASPPREKLTENPSKRQRTSRAARGQDEWEAIPAELQAEWAREGESKDMKKEAVELGSEKRKREASEGASSALTSLGDEDEEEEDEDEEPVKPQRRPRPTYKKEEPERGSDFEPEEEAEEESESEAEEEEGSEAGTEGDEMMKWERDFWAERDRIEGLEGFVEWEAVSRLASAGFTFAEVQADSPSLTDMRHPARVGVAPRQVCDLQKQE